MANSGELFEGYIEFIYRTLLHSQGKNISVSRRATVYDNRGNPYNIDVFYEFDVAGVHHRVAIECKDTRRKVERDDVLAFAGKIRDLPSTVGIFISRSGFQSAAEKYLRDHGILHYSGGDLPSFGNVLASMISSVALPSEAAVGQPFWSLMSSRNGEAKGDWSLIPDYGPDGIVCEDPNLLFPLFFSKPQAELFRELTYGSDPDVCVRGLEQATLRFLIMCADDVGGEFAILEPRILHDRQMFSAETMTARQLAKEYCMYDLSSEFVDQQNRPRGWNSTWARP